MRQALAAGILLGGIVFVGYPLASALSADRSQPASSQQSKPVLELFTSQGCSSCPPADALLEKYIASGNVIALSLPVDYWDRLGWKDTFANPAYSQRQRDYASGRGDGHVYTPQIVVNGRAHAVGSSRSEIDKLIASSQASNAASSVATSLRWDAGVLKIDIAAAPSGANAAPATVLIATVQTKGSVKIGRGENSGNTLVYHNIVRSLKPVGTWNGSAVSIQVPRNSIPIANTQSVAVLIQQGAGGPLIGAAQLSYDDAVRPPSGKEAL